jgi:DNA recombination protein RmuC
MMSRIAIFGDVIGEESGVNVEHCCALSIAPFAASGYDRSLFVLASIRQKGPAMIEGLQAILALEAAPETIATAAILGGVLAGLALIALAVLLWRTRKRPDPQAAVMAELARAQADAAARLETMIRMVGDRQSQLQHAVNDRLDSVSHRLGDSMEKTKLNTAENLQKLAERLAVIDNAQKNITALATQVTSLQSVLANKQSRGAFGQARMEAIVQDGLPKGTYAFQHTLSNRTRPDCCVFLPDNRLLVIDAKFPLEGVTAYRDAKSDDERKFAAQRLRTDVSKHIADIAEKYSIPGETQELALMFVPSESVYAEIYDGFDDLVQKAFRARVVLVSPSLLMLAIALVQQSQRDVRMREAADLIRDEVGRLVKDVGLLGERVRKLQTHFNQANEDIRQSVISVEKIEGRGERIAQVEFSGVEALGSSGLGANVIPVPIPRKLEAGE